MRILLLCTDAYGGHGGIALFNRELLDALSRHPDVTEIVVLPRLVPHALEEIAPNVRFVERAARNARAYMTALVREVRGRAFDLVICGHVNLLPLARLAANAPLLITHGIDAWKPLRDPASRRFVHHCRGVVCVSAVTRDRFVAWSQYSGPTFVLPNAIRRERYSIRARRADLVARYGLDGKRVILTVGRLAAAERYKGFDELFEVLPQLPDDVTYLVAGGGDDLPRLQKKADTLGIANRVVFTGRFDERDKADLYNLADVYAMPSRGEGFGFVFLEAMASGLPVIASKHDGGREALRHGELGLLVDPSNCAELRAAIEELLGRERAVPPGLAFFDFERFVERVHAIVESVR